MSFFTNDGMRKYAEASLLGAGRGLFGLPIEHPFDTVKTRAQANLETRSIITTITNVYKESGVRGFYSGAIPNATRIAVKQMYRWPMMLGFPPFFKEVLPENIQKDYPSSVKTATGLTIASFETGIISPLERLKVYLMTCKAEQKKISQFFIQNKGKLLPELTRGLGAVYVRQMTSWVSFLVADDKFKKWEKARTQSENMSFTSLLRVSFLVGAVNTAANMPFDVLKTNLQKDKFIANQGMLKTLGKIYQTHGVRGLYAGWQVRMMQYMIQSVFTVALLERLEKSWNKK